MITLLIMLSQIKDHAMLLLLLNFLRSCKSLVTGHCLFCSRFSCGYLLGSIAGDEVAVYDIVGLDLKLFENVDWTQAISPSILAEFSLITASVPVGINFVGLYVTQPENGNLEVCFITLLSSF